MRGREGKDEPTRMNIQTTPPRRDVRRSSRSYKGVRSGTDRRGEVTKQNLMSLRFVRFLHDLSTFKIENQATLLKTPKISTIAMLPHH